MNSKRNTLKKIVGVGAVASVLPNAWVKPVVNSVMLPVHGQTSNVSSPEIDPIGTVNIDDNAGAITAHVTNITGTNIDSLAIYSISSVVGLTLDTGTGFMISGNTVSFQGNIGTDQSPIVTVQVLNPDGGTDTETFTVNINNNA